MLLRFEVSNHRSIMDPAELSMIAVDADRPATRAFDRLDERVLTVAGIYGPNASGKSNVVDALAWLSWAVGGSLRGWEENVPRDPFRTDERSARSSTYEVDFVVDGVRYTYRLEVDDAQVLTEGLYSYPERRRRMLFEREGSEIHGRRELGSLVGIRELMTSTSLALSAATRLQPHDKPSEIAVAGRYLREIRAMSPALVPAARGRLRAGAFVGRSPTSMLMSMFAGDAPSAAALGTREGPTSDRDAALALLRFADLGIEDVEVVEEQIEGADPRAGPRVRPRLQFVHRFGDETTQLDYYDESAGTQTWMRLIGPVLGAFRRGAVVVVDEIDASLHPRLSARLVEMFQDPETNPRGAQLIFTTHDTSLLNHLNRDEVWLTEKGEDGATTLTALAEFGGDKVRRSTNLEKAYLSGRFGAVPEPDQQMLRQALGLAVG